jgi:hypothetical protein
MHWFKTTWMPLWTVGKLKSRREQEIKIYFYLIREFEKNVYKTTRIYI